MCSVFAKSAGSVGRVVDVNDRFESVFYYGMPFGEFRVPIHGVDLAGRQHDLGISQAVSVKPYERCSLAQRRFPWKDAKEATIEGVFLDEKLIELKATMESVPSYILADFTRNLALADSGWSPGPNNSFEHWIFKRGNISLSVRLIEYKNDHVVLARRMAGTAL
jgi:hypothetical protein